MNGRRIHLRARPYALFMSVAACILLAAPIRAYQLRMGTSPTPAEDVIITSVLGEGRPGKIDVVVVADRFHAGVDIKKEGTYMIL